MLIEEGDEQLKEIVREARKFAWNVIALIVLIIAFAIFSTGLNANPSNCTLFADVGVTSKALALEGVPKETTNKVIERMYQPQSPRAEVVLYRIVNRAYADTQGLNAFVQQLYAACVVAGGNPEQFLGVPI